MKHLCKLLYLITLLLLTGCTTKLPIIAVQLSDDDGNNRAPVTPQEIEHWVNRANTSWKGSGYKFTFDPDKDIIQVSSTVLNSKPDDAANPQWELYRLTGNYLASLLPRHQIPVLFRQRGQTGWSGGPGHSNFISMPSYSNTCIKKQTGGACRGGCCPDDTLLAHQLGHYLGLVHTNTNVPCDKVKAEIADGDRQGWFANNKEDDIRDTAPDPGANCAPTTSADCDTGKVKIKNGNSFRPPWRNVMSAHNCLPEQISGDQEDAVEWVLENNPWRQQIGND
ncbi:MAG: hypothetical protein OEZ39_00230 [Gammaproteobacteria bacterium]|nr:hypothetical protein [Gammaproteobacteria bacterium]MDH5650274.1 hypothetical protein [Gammaproteobacteria bacterium]